ncbi:MAG TPA: helix-turn-helix transcriptional regulator [Solirubrobacteraceae bacterium]|nr:helix-turn-helix transcriptional regulator [Solirubrobacteraceae bacterium]
MCQLGLDARMLRRQIIEELRRVVTFEAHAWLLTDPATAVGAAPVAEVPWMRELPHQIRLKYATRINRWTTLGNTPAALLYESTAGAPAQSLVWRELLVRYGIGDVASVVFEDRFGCWAFLELWRSTTEAPFTRAEARFLADLADPLTAALRGCQAGTFVVRPPRDSPRVGPVVLLLSPELDVRNQTPQAQQYLRALVPPAVDRQPIPAVAYNVAAQLLAVEDGIDSHPPTARVHVSDGFWMTVRAARLQAPGSPSRQDIAVTLEESSAAERVDLFCRAHGLTARERELIDHLVAGHATREIARCMFLSENTVQDHLKSIFAKTDSRSRRTLLSRAIGS